MVVFYFCLPTITAAGVVSTPADRRWRAHLLAEFAILQSSSVQGTVFVQCNPTPLTPQVKEVNEGTKVYTIGIWISIQLVPYIHL